MIRLSAAELMAPALVGLCRQVRAIGDGRRDRFTPTDQWGVHIEGAISEFVIARSTGLFWDPAIGSTPAGDVGPLGVRITSHQRGCLLLYEHDDDDRVFVLVTGRAPEYEIRGWIRARDGKRPEYWTTDTRSGYPAFFVPQAALSAGLPEVPIHARPDVVSRRAAADRSAGR